MMVEFTMYLQRANDGRPRAEITIGSAEANKIRRHTHKTL